MISLALIAEKYQQQLIYKYGDKMQTVHRHALKQIITCHTPRAGAMSYHCDHCNLATTLFPSSCGHRHCPACQHTGKTEKGVYCLQCQGEMQLYLLRIGTRLIINGKTI